MAEKVQSSLEDRNQARLRTPLFILYNPVSGKLSVEEFGRQLRQHFLGFLRPLLNTSLILDLLEFRALQLVELLYPFPLLPLSLECSKILFLLLLKVFDFALECLFPFLLLLSQFPRERPTFSLIESVVIHPPYLFEPFFQGIPDLGIPSIFIY